MKAILAVIAVSTAALGAAACESDGYYDGNYYGGGAYYGNRYSPAWYDGWYDNYYGPIYNGYWAGDVFFYQVHSGDRYFRDDSRHFRRDEFRGGVRFRYQDRGDHTRWAGDGRRGRGRY